MQPEAPRANHEALEQSIARQPYTPPRLEAHGAYSMLTGASGGPGEGTLDLRLPLRLLNND